MCTVSYIPVKDKFFITTNRDEKLSRKNAIAPSLFFYNEQKLFFPKDGDAGGTWIAMKENGDAAVLLNGAFINHDPEPPYRLSRGIIMLDIFSESKPSIAFAKTDLRGIEPFTFVLLEKKLLYEFRWDGIERYKKPLNRDLPYLWSSATLYDGLTVKKREQWFHSFLKNHPDPTQQDILRFHRFTGDGDKQNDLLMARDGKHKTVSITNILLSNDLGCMTYIDIPNNITTEIKVELLHSTPKVE